MPLLLGSCRLVDFLSIEALYTDIARCYILKYNIVWYCLISALQCCILIGHCFRLCRDPSLKQVACLLFGYKFLNFGANLNSQFVNCFSVYLISKDKQAIRYLTCGCVFVNFIGSCNIDFPYRSILAVKNYTFNKHFA